MRVNFCLIKCSYIRMVLFFTILIGGLIGLSKAVYGAEDEPYQGSYLVKAKMYIKGENKGQKVKTVYIRYPKSQFTIKGIDSTFYLNEDFIENAKDYGLTISKKVLLIADEVHQLKYKNEVITHFLIGKNINVSQVDSVVSDSSLWGDWGGTEQWVDSLTGNILLKNKVTFIDTIMIENGGYQFLHIAGLDTSWTQVKYRKLVDEQVFQDLEAIPDREKIKKFHPSIQKAIKEHKLFFYTTWTP